MGIFPLLLSGKDNGNKSPLIQIADEELSGKDRTMNLLKISGGDQEHDSNNEPQVLAFGWGGASSFGMWNRKPCQVRHIDLSRVLTRTGEPE